MFLRPALKFLAANKKLTVNFSNSIRGVSNLQKPKSHMSAQVIKTFGPAKDAFQLASIKTPSPTKNQMLVKVEASSVNPVDCKIRSGVYPALAPDNPAILHGDVSGTVIEVGEDISKFKIGDMVYGCAGGFKGTQGALAEYMVVDPDLMAMRPSSLTAVESAIIPLVAITSWEALITRAAISANQNVLIHAAAGGVGSLAFQLSLWKQANTFTTVSDDVKAQFASKRGATTINYKQKSVEEYVKEYTAGKGFDVVFDTVGGANLANSIDACKVGGVVCAIAAAKDFEAGLMAKLHRKGLTLHYVFMPNIILNLTAKIERQRYGEILTQVSRLVDQGMIKPLVGEVLDFSDIVKAHERLESGKTLGKIGLLQNLDDSQAGENKAKLKKN